MARPAEESEASEVGEVRPGGRPLNSTHQDFVGEASDGDGGEKPVREKLKKTSIASLTQYTNFRNTPALQEDELPTTTESRGEQADISSNATSAVRGRPARKRSYDDLQKEDTQTTAPPSQVAGTVDKGSHHKRMRSRDISGGEGLVSNGQPRAEPLEYHDEEESDIDARRSPGGPGVMVEPPAVTGATLSPTKVTADDAILSPKKKRSRDQFDKDQDPQDEGSDDSGDSIVRSGSEPAENDDQLAQAISRTATGEPEKKRPRDDELKSEVSRMAKEGLSLPSNNIHPVNGLSFILIFTCRLNQVLALQILRQPHLSQHSQDRNLPSQRTRQTETAQNESQKKPPLQTLHLHPQASQPSLAQKNLRSQL